MRLRNLLAGCGVALVAAGCTGGAGSGTKLVPDASVAVPITVEPESAEVKGLSARFDAVRAAAQLTQVAAGSGAAAKSRLRAPHPRDPARETLTPAAPIVDRIEREGTQLHPRINAAARAGVGNPVDVFYADSADGAFRVLDLVSAAEIRVTLEGASPVAAATGDGVVLYPAGYHGADVLHRPSAEGTEDSVLFPSQPQLAQVVYDVALGSRVAGLRLVERTVEFLDEGGAPRLRMAAPFVDGSDGHRVEPRVSIVGCGADTSPVAPFGRALTPIGAQKTDASGLRHCEILLDWSEARVAYPAVLDPNWQATGSMAGARQTFTLTVMGNNKILAAGGEAKYRDTRGISSAEIYDPAMGTWAMTAAMGSRRSAHTATALKNGNVLVVGGLDNLSGEAAGKDMLGGNTSLKSAEIYDPNNGTWTPTPALNQGRGSHRAVRLVSGDVMVSGGYQDYDQYFVDSAEIYSVAMNKWTQTAKMPRPREGHVMELLPSGKVLVAGGWDAAVYSLKTDVYDPNNNTWATVADMLPAQENMAAQWQATSALLTDNTVLVVGGYNDNCNANCMAPVGNYSKTSQTYDPAKDAWSYTLPMASGRYAHSMSHLTCGGQVLVAGGYNGSNYLKQSEVYDTLNRSWTSTSSMIDLRAYHSVVIITGQFPKALVAGGAPVVGMAGDLSIAKSELYSGFNGIGCFCNGDTDCVSNHCKNNLCCNTACSGACDVCAMNLGAKQDGICTVLPKGNSGAPSCAPYVCDGANSLCPASCAGNADCAANFVCSCGNTCVPAQAAGACCVRNDQCASAVCANGVCCDKACGGACQACNLPGKVGTCSARPKGDPGSPACMGFLCDGASGTCPNACKVDADCDANSVCNCNGLCVAKASQVNGSCCTRGQQCASNNCSNGVCCNSICNSACASCNLMGSVGTCTNLPAGQPGSPPCAPYACNGLSASCPNSCAKDADCANGNICNCLGQCVAPQGNGACCVRGAQCGSGQCANGVCCNAACGGSCQACNLPGAVGTCTPQPKGANPNGACGVNTCDGVNGTCPMNCVADADCAFPSICDCNGKCVNKVVNGGCCTRGNQCNSGNCANGVCCDSPCGGPCQQCNQQGFVGVCKTAVAGFVGSPPCVQQACDGMNPFCPTTCQFRSQCNIGDICNCQNQCAKPGALGACCTADIDCAGAICWNPTGGAKAGICCNRACGVNGANCEACNNPGSEGTCSNVPKGGAGQPACAPFLCNGNSASCPNSCAVDADCSVGNICNCMGQCVPKLANGQCCKNNGQCTSGNCVDGFCCDTGCGRSCEACNVMGKEGTCSVQVKGNAGRPSCAPYSCDGVGRDCPAGCKVDADCKGGLVCSCAGFCVAAQANGACCSANLQCASGFCVGGVCCNSQCNGNCASCNVPGSEGKCSVVAKGQPGVPVCGPYVCDGAGQSCPSTCTSEADCSAGNVCDCTNHCVPKQANGACCTRAAQCNSNFCVGGVCCDGACGGACQTCNAQGKVGTCSLISQGLQGNPSCQPFACDGQNANCPMSCASEKDCANGFVCNCLGKCVPPQGNGLCCTRNAQCSSGNCVDGFCCDGACSGGCQACNVKGKEGTCTVLVKGDVGKGNGGMGCAPFVCDGVSGQCPGACRLDADCKPGLFCDCQGKCVAQVGLGECCQSNGICQSGHCANNVCCNSDCQGACARCDLPNLKGQCSAAPKGSTGRPNCQPYICDGTHLDCPMSCSNMNLTCNEVTACCANACIVQSAIGAACAQNCECKSGFCADGFCCDTSCSGQCDVCNAPGKEGSCTLIAKGQPGMPACGGGVLCDGMQASCPNGCTVDADCGGGLICNCTRQCVAPQMDGACCKADNQCANNHCVGGICCNAACDGNCASCAQQGKQGMCLPLPAGDPGKMPCGGGALCNGVDLVCPGGCMKDDDCAGGKICDCTNQCVDKLAPGLCCTRTSQCKSGFCVDGLCCDAPCTGACDRCDIINSKGTCTKVAAGGSGMPACANNLVCDGNSAECPMKCTVDKDCAGGFVCDCNGACVKGPLPIGACCKQDSSCTEGNCVDGVCCDSKCAGQCSACNIGGKVGKCSPVPAGTQPVGGRPLCVGSDASVCRGSCDGVNMNTCSAGDPATCGQVTGGGCICSVGHAGSQRSDGGWPIVSPLMGLLAMARLGRRRRRA